MVLPLLLSIGNLLGINTANIIILIIMAITMIINGFILGKNSTKRGYIKGLILGLIISLIFFLLSLLFKNTYSLNTFIYYLVLITSSIIGSMLGIQKSNKN